jgi:hypothetical protein
MFVLFLIILTVALIVSLRIAANRTWFRGTLSVKEIAAI